MSETQVGAALDSMTAVLFMGAMAQRRGKAATDRGSETRSILDSIRRIVRALRLADRAAEKRLGLSGAQLFVLHKLAVGPALSLNELADRTLTHQSSVSVVVQRLVKRKLAARARSGKD